MRIFEFVWLDINISCLFVVC